MAPSQILTCILYVFMHTVAHTQAHFLSAPVGDEVVLTCSSLHHVRSGARLYWFKYSIGMEPTVITVLNKYNQKGEFYGQFQNDRFTLHETDLHISDVQMSDSAIYHCIIRLGYELKFVESIALIVRDLNSELRIHQSASEIIEPGQSVSLKCNVQAESCGGGHRVHWFKQSEESAAGVLYSHGGTNTGDGCKNDGKSPTNICVYNLPIHNVSAEQTGTYYCAVAACGQVLFGNGTRVSIDASSSGALKAAPVHVYVLSGALMFTSSLLIAMTLYLCLKNSSGSGENSASSAKSKGFPKLVQYMAAEQRAEESRRLTDGTWTECIYYSMDMGFK
ncbi:uncharacterized protein LOC110168904 isoform X1 [Boleophthalmus pectinirostris]|uniref:uncharacterized protein LOC110168904 isoform X1 n=1 Tax=Boleophthalmus pectinirostris TaxID=150288 RepID=UPI002431E1ED|nr:uncharacterized protein LOC110168904 isoform X1 [Boleophthalmus pectinirostris]